MKLEDKDFCRTFEIEIENENLRYIPKCKKCGGGGGVIEPQRDL